MLPHSSLVVVLLVCGTGLLRGAALSRTQSLDDRPASESIAALSKDLVANSADLHSRLSEAGIARVDRLRFDDSAAVILTYGADNKPGQAAMDDNRDKIIDNAAEIGAVGSDDQCLAPWDPAYPKASQQDGTVAISRGTFIAVDNDSSGVDDRFLLQGRSGNSDWTWMVVR